MKKLFIIPLILSAVLFSCTKEDTGSYQPINPATSSAKLSPTPVCTAYFLSTPKGFLEGSFSYVTCSGDTVRNLQVGDLAIEVCVNAAFPVTVTGQGIATSNGSCGGSR